MFNQYNQQYTPYNRNNGITWVQGIEGAKAYQLMPNSNIILMDSENEVFYIKSCDNVGMCSLRIFSYTEVNNAPSANSNLDEYVRKDELEALLNNLLGGNSNGKSTVQSTKHQYSEKTSD